jgi:hypothetical protein
MTFDCKAVRCCPLHRRQFLTASAVLGAALLLPGTARSAAVRQLQGNVRVNGQRATRSTRVRPGDTIETGPNSRFVFVVGQDAFLLREQSRLALDRSQAGKGVAISGLRLVTGALLAVFGKGLRVIETAAATAGIRGTGVYLEASTTETYFCACYGEVELRDKAGSVRKLVVSGYHTPNMIYARMVDGKMMAPSVVKNHTDDELIMLERLVGRTSAIVDRNEKLKAPAAPPQPRPGAAPEGEPPPAQPKPQAEVPAPAAATEPAPAPSPTPPPEPPKPEAPPSDAEWRLPPPRLR